MSGIEYFYQGDIYGYQELSFDEINQNDVGITIESPSHFEVFKRANVYNVTVEIPVEKFEELAIAWCKKRNLLGGPVGREIGSSENPWE